MATSPLDLNSLDSRIAALQNVLYGPGQGLGGIGPYHTKDVAKLQAEIQQLMAQRDQVQAGQETAKQSALADQAQSTLLPKISSLYDLYTSLLGQEKDQGAQILPFIQEMAKSQQGLAGLQGKLAQDSIDRGNLDQQQRMEQVGKLQPLISQYESEANTPLDSLTPIANAQYQSDLDNINNSYNQNTDAGLKQLETRGMGGAPSGAFSSLINSSASSRAKAQTESRRNALALSQQYRDAARGNAAGLRSGLAQMFDPTAAASLGANANQSASGMYGSAANTENSSLAPYQVEAQGLSGLSSGLGMSSGAYGDVGSMFGGAARGNLSGAASSDASATDAMNWATQAQNLEGPGLFSKIMGGIGSIGGLVAAPFTGGASLGLSGLLNMFKKTPTGGYPNSGAGAVGGYNPVTGTYGN